MKLVSRLLAGCAALTMAVGPVSGAAAQDAYSGDTIKIGILNDMNGPYSATVGAGLVSVVEWAAEDFGGKVNGKPIEVYNADTQLKADIASTTVRQWVDEDGVDVVIAGSGSAISLAAMEVGKEKGIAILNTGGLSSDLSNSKCTDTATHWSIDTLAAARMGAKAGARLGGKTWFFIAADYSFGESLQRDTEAELAKTDAKVLGGVRAPLGTTDFSSFLLQAQSSGADIVALANAGNDTMNALKQANEFGLPAGGQKMVGLVVSITDTYALGLEAANGLVATEGFYWDRDDETRAFTKRFEAKYGKAPTQTQAVAYSAVTHYLRAAEAAGTDDGRTVTAQMKKMPVKDFFAIDGVVRADGRMVPKYLYMLQAKKPEDSKGGWDLYNIIEKVPGEQVFRSLDESVCPLVKN